MRSEKIVEVAALPIRMNLQTFAEEPDEETFEDMVEKDNEDEFVEIEDEPEEEPEEEVPEFKQDKQNQAFAQIRREKEEYERKFNDLNKRFATQFKDYNVSTADEYLAKFERQQEETKQNELQTKANAGDMDAIQELATMGVLNSPIIKQMIEENQLARQQREKEQTAQAEAELKRQIDDLNSVYGTNINGIDGLLQMENANVMLDYMQKGLTATESYLLTNRDAVIQGEHTKANQEAMKKLTGRNHMKTPSGNTEKINNVKIPRDVYNSYKQFFTDMTDKEIRAAYTKELKNEGVI